MAKRRLKRFKRISWSFSQCTIVELMELRIRAHEYAHSPIPFYFTPFQ